MKQRSKNIFLPIIGFFFLLIGIIAIYNSITYSVIDQIFWFCYASLIILGIGVLRKNSPLITSQLLILTIPALIWNIDFFYLTLTSQPLWGITNYFFLQGPILPKIITLQHTFTVPLGLYTLYIIKIKRKDIWIPSLFQIALIFLISKSLTNPDYNINCVFRSCASFISTAQYYTLTWFILTFLMVILTNLALIKLPFLNPQEKTNQ